MCVGGGGGEWGMPRRGESSRGVGATAGGHSRKHSKQIHMYCFERIRKRNLNIDVRLEKYSCLPVNLWDGFVNTCVHYMHSHTQHNRLPPPPFFLGQGEVGGGGGIRIVAQKSRKFMQDCFHTCIFS